MPIENTLLLDTHIWIWLINGDKTLHRESLELINKAANSGQLYVSTISTWEISMLESRKRITLGRPCLDWIKTSLDLTGIKAITLSPEIAVESCQLPDDFHGDPADRIIVATARLNNLTVMTRDKKILAYGEKKYVKTTKG